MFTSPGYLPHLLGKVVKVEARDCVSILSKYLSSCTTEAASYQHSTLWRSPGAMPPSALGQTVALLPGAIAGEGMARCVASIVGTTTAGQPRL